MSKRRSAPSAPSPEEVKSSISTAKSLKPNDVINARGFAGDAQLKVVRSEEVEVEGSDVGDVIVYVTSTNQRIRLDSNYVNASKHAIKIIATARELTAQPQFHASAQSTVDAVKAATSESAVVPMVIPDRSQSLPNDASGGNSAALGATAVVESDKSPVDVEGSMQPPPTPTQRPSENDEPRPSPPEQGPASETDEVEDPSEVEGNSNDQLEGVLASATQKARKSEETIAADILEEVLLALAFKTELDIVVAGERGTAIKCPGIGNGPFTWELPFKDLTEYNSNRGFDVTGVRSDYNLTSTPMSFFMFLREMKKKNPASCSFISFNGNPNGFNILDEASFAKLATTRVAAIDRTIYHEVASDLLFVSESQSLVIGSGTLGERRTLLNLRNFKLDTCKGIKESTILQLVALIAIGQKYALDGNFMEGRGRSGIAISQIRYLNDLTPVLVLCLMRAVDATNMPFTNVALVYSLRESLSYLVSVGSVLPRSQEAQFSLPLSSGVPIDHVTILVAFRSGREFLECTVVKADDQVFQAPRASVGSAKGTRRPFAEACKIGARGKSKQDKQPEDASSSASDRQQKRAAVSKSDKTPARNFESKGKAPVDGNFKRGSNGVPSEIEDCELIDLVGEGAPKRHVPEKAKEPIVRCPQQPSGFSVSASAPMPSVVEEAKYLREIISFQNTAYEKLVEATEKGKNEVIEALRVSAEDQKVNTKFVVKVLADERSRGQEDSRHIAEHARLMSTSEVPTKTQPRGVVVPSIAYGQLDQSSELFFQKASDKEKAVIRMRQQAAALPEGAVRNAILAQCSAFEVEMEQLTSKGLELIAEGK